MSVAKGQKMKLKAEAFLKNRKNANNLIEIIAMLEKTDGKQLKRCVTALDMIFETVFTSGQMNHKPDQTSVEKKYQTWLRDMYEIVFTKLIAIFMGSRDAEQSMALELLMKLIVYEGRHPLQNENPTKHKFARLKQFLTALVSSDTSTKAQIIKFATYAKYQDIVHDAWKILTCLVNEYTAPNECFKINFIRLAGKLIVAPTKKSTGKAQLVLTKDEGYSINENRLSKSIDDIWQRVTKWTLTPRTHNLLLAILIKKVMPHLKTPLYLSDYLISTFQQGGALGVLALQALLNLIQKFNLEYPDVYEKLYQMIDADIFQLKYKERLFYLTDMFLSSSHLPQSLVGAFVKRLARLSLVAPAHDVQIILAFVGNLLIRHSGLKKLLIGSHQNPEKVCDPYDMNETNPKKSKAMDSFLWEIHSLQQHYLPGIANTAKDLINNPLPAIEWDLSLLLDGSQDQLFDRELKKKPHEITLTYDKPQSMRLREGERLLQYWTLD